MKHQVAIWLFLVAFVSPVVCDAETFEVFRGTQLDTLLGLPPTAGGAKNGDRIHLNRGGTTNRGGVSPGYIAPSNGWTIDRCLEIFGDGPGMSYETDSSTVLMPYDGANPVLVINVSGSHSQILQEIYIHDLRIAQSGTLPKTANSLSNGIYLKITDNNYLLALHLARLRIMGMGNNGIHLEGKDGTHDPVGVSIEDCNANFNTGDGLHAQYVNALTVRGGNYEANWHKGVSLVGCQMANLVGLVLESNERGSGGVSPDTQSPAQLRLESCPGFLVTGCHFEAFAYQESSSSPWAISISNCQGGYIGSCFFDGQEVSGSTGIYVFYPKTSGIVVGPNGWQNVDKLIEVLDNAEITSCTVLPQSIGYSTGVASKIVVPETGNRGHIVYAASTNTSNLTAGVAVPLLSGAKRDSLTAASSGGTRREGLVVYNSTKHRLDHWDGTRWLEGIAGVAGSEIDSTNVTQPIGSTTILNSPSAGMYRVSIYAATKSTMNKVHTITLAWNDGSSRSFGFNLGTSVGSFVLETPPIYINSGNLTYSTSIPNGTMSGSFVLRMRVEAMP